MNPGDRAMGLMLSSGGHLSHGFELPTKKVHLTSKMYNWAHYEYEEDGAFDFDKIKKQALEFKPKLFVIGFSAYPRTLDFEKFREIADACGALLMCDMAHISGLIAAKESPSPFEHCHIVTSTSHKTLRGPRGSLIYAKNEVNGTPLLEDIADALSPNLHASFQNHSLPALANALYSAKKSDFKEYQQQVIRNAKSFGKSLEKRGFNIFTGGTDNHMLLVDLRKKNIDGGRVETCFNALNLIVNKNTLKGDVSALKPSGLRVGTPAMTSRSFGEKEFDQVAEFMDRGVDIAVKYNTFKKLVNYKNKIRDLAKNDDEFKGLKTEIESFASSYPYHDFKI